MVTKKTIGLVIVVAAVWGTIAFKIFQSLGSEDYPERTFVVRENSITAGDSREDYPLALNYPDPFYKKNKKTYEQTGILDKRRLSPKPAKVVHDKPNIIVQWGKIEYLGSMSNASRNSGIATLRIDGIEYIGKQGDKVNEFLIEKIFPDSVLLSLGPEHKYIIKKQ